ncbi:hypothetical protein INT43_002280 [Umbelopsis isabellina]|uniref:Uncharacterized protein n=1 Tax=Mortierella isabellina TaxID=91625 RepID=A0A8H7UN41_MORIS|nr:hypothetical protein INT43_002280 [Umbelopsis isabellina]
MDTKLKKLLFRSSQIGVPTRWSTPQPPSEKSPVEERPRQSLDCPRVPSTPPRLSTPQHRTWRKPLPKEAPQMKVYTQPDYRKMDQNVTEALNALQACNFTDLPESIRSDFLREQRDAGLPSGQLRSLGTASSLYSKHYTQLPTSAPEATVQYPVRQTSRSYQSNVQVTTSLKDASRKIEQRYSRQSIDSSHSDNTSGEESHGPPTPRHSFSSMSTSPPLQTSGPPEPPKHNFDIPQIVTTLQKSLPNSPIEPEHKTNVPADYNYTDKQVDRVMYLRPKVASIKRNGSVKRKNSARRHVSLRRHVNTVLAGAFDEADDEWENESDEDDEDLPLEVYTRQPWQPGLHMLSHQTTLKGM